MRNRISALSLMIAATLFTIIAKAESEDTIYIPQQDSLSVEETYVEVEEEVKTEEVVSDPLFVSLMMPDYIPWHKATIQGKLKMQGLPLSPSVKIFMVKDSLIDISLRAPFVGEAGRVQLTADSVIAVNKIGKTYIKERITDFLRYYPGGIKDVQDLLMARFFLPGFNVEEADLEKLVDIYIEDERFTVVPKGEAKIEGVRYGFVVDNIFRPYAVIVMPEGRDDVEIDATYNYTLSGYDLQLLYQEGSRAMELTLDLKNPEYGGDMPKGIDIGKNYRQVNWIDFLKF